MGDREKLDVEALEESILLATLGLKDEIESYLGRGALSLRGIWLEGRYPDTQLIVTCLSANRAAEGKLAFNLWTTFVVNGIPMTPSVAAGIVATNVMEGVWEWSG